MNIQAPRRQPRKPLPRRRSPHRRKKGPLKMGCYPTKPKAFLLILRFSAFIPFIPFIASGKLRLILPGLGRFSIKNGRCSGLCLFPRYICWCNWMYLDRKSSSDFWNNPKTFIELVLAWRLWDCDVRLSNNAQRLSATLQPINTISRRPKRSGFCIWAFLRNTACLNSKILIERYW